jgi:hypothetical protein
MGKHIAEALRPDHAEPRPYEEQAGNWLDWHSEVQSQTDPALFTQHVSILLAR